MPFRTVGLRLSERSSITSEVLQKTVSRINVKVPDHLVDDYTATLNDAHQAIETVLAMDGLFKIVCVCLLCLSSLL